MDNLVLKVGARVMLIYNVCTIDGLTNGLTGSVIEIERRKNEKEFIIVKFDDPDAGEEERRKFPWVAKKFGSQATPISKITFEYSVGDASKDHTKKVRIIQYPLTLAFALTAHKIQGQTVTAPKPVGLNLDTVFQANQAYVMLGRTESLNQLYLQKFKPGKIYCDKKSKEETLRIMADSKQALMDNKWFSSQNLLKVSALNINSLINKFDDLKTDYCLLQSDVIVISETHYYHGFKNIPKLDGYQDYHVKAGKGKGNLTFILSFISLHMVKFIFLYFFRQGSQFT